MESAQHNVSDNIVKTANQILDSLNRSKTIMPAEDENKMVPEKNPILVAADALLLQLVRIKGTKMVPENLEDFQQRLLADIDKFTADVRRAGQLGLLCYIYRYLLCASIDEAILLSNTNQATNWRKHSLLNHYYNETEGGENFFAILEALLHFPEQNVFALEFIYVFISLGFKGKYHLLDEGEHKLEILRKELFNNIRSLRKYRIKKLIVNYQKPEYPISKQVRWRMFAALIIILPTCTFLIYYLLLMYEVAPMIQSFRLMVAHLS